MQKIESFINEYSFLKGKTVGVAVSGGVDSSVTALLLKKAGADVFGIHMNIDAYNSDFVENRARLSAETMEIPFHSVDVGDDFESIVIQQFLDTYEKGNTPNPCLICDRNIKWKRLQTFALENGADYFATGHYATIVHEEGKPSRLFMAENVKKDQSYVLSVLPQERLAKTIFPLSKFSKDEIREIAEFLKIPSAQTKDSQDLCFLKNGMLPSFLDERIPSSGVHGEIRMLDEEVVGEHIGLHNYTIGQRKGLGIAYREPLYVLKKDVENNVLYVCIKADLKFDRLSAKEVNWVSGMARSEPFEGQVKIRYGAKPVPAKIQPIGEDEMYVEFESHLIDVTPGQGAVVYDGTEVICSGFIDNNFV